MAYSFTEKKRIRKNFGKFPNVMDLPYLLAIQIDSYKNFTQLGVSSDERRDTGLHAALDSIFPIVGHQRFKVTFNSFRFKRQHTDATMNDAAFVSTKADLTSLRIFDCGSNVSSDCS